MTGSSYAYTIAYVQVRLSASSSTFLSKYRSDPKVAGGMVPPCLREVSLSQTAASVTPGHQVTPGLTLSSHTTSSHTSLLGR